MSSNEWSEGLGQRMPARKEEGSKPGPLLPAALIVTLIYTWAVLLTLGSVGLIFSVSSQKL
jgi:hypothetical protein